MKAPKERDFLKTMFYLIGTIIILVILVLSLLGCETTPIMKEYCLDYENYQFYQIEKQTTIGTKQSWVLKTPKGDLEIPDNVYEGAMDYEYSKICYETEDAVATTYLYTIVGEDIRPEPEQVEVEVIVEVPVEVPIYTYEAIDPEGFVIMDHDIVFIYIQENIGMLIYTEEASILGGSITGYYRIPILFDPSFSGDEYFIPEITFYTLGLTTNLVPLMEDFIPTEFESIDDVIQDFIAKYPTFESITPLYEETEPFNPDPYEAPIEE